MIPRHVYEQTLRGLLAPLTPMLEDDAVSEILVNAPDVIYVECGGRLRRTEARFESREALLSALRGIAQYVGRPLGPDHPVLEGHLPDGSRVQALLPPAAPDGPILAIRRFPNHELTVARLVDEGALTADAAALLKGLVEVKQNLLLAGGTGSGKTSLLNALSSFIPDDQRIVVIEDARELQLQKSHVVQLETHPPGPDGRGGIDVRALFKASLRLRPDRIVLGEIRGGEALELVQAMTSGHGGCMSTLHASHPVDVLHRLETMSLMSGVEIPLHALRAQVASAIDILVQTGRFSHGARGVTHITEVKGYDTTDGYRLEHLYIRSGRAPRTLIATGALPGCAQMLESCGAPLPESMLQAAAQARSGHA